MDARAFPWSRLGLFVVFSVMDVVLTTVLIRYSGGRIQESNPIAGAWLAHFGWAGLVLFKSLAVAVVGLASVLIWRHRPRLGTCILTLACVAAGAVTAYSFFLLFSTLE